MDRREKHATPKIGGEEQVERDEKITGAPPELEKLPEKYGYGGAKERTRAHGSSIMPNSCKLAWYPFSAISVGRERVL